MEKTIRFSESERNSAAVYSCLREDEDALHSATTQSALGEQIPFEGIYPSRRYTTNISSMTIRVYRNVVFSVRELRVASGEFPAVYENRIEVKRPRLLDLDESEVMPIVPYHEGTWAHCLQDVLPIAATLRAYLSDHPKIRLLIHRPDFDIRVVLRALGINNAVFFMGKTSYSCAKLHQIDYQPNATVYFWPSCMFREFSVALQIRSRPKRCIIYISRSDVSTRRVENEPEIESVLHLQSQRLGLSYIKFNKDGYSLIDAMEIFRSAAVIVAPHGGANYHLLFSSPGTLFIEFCMTRELHCLANIALSLGMNYWMIPINSGKSCPKFKAPAEKVVKIIELNQGAVGL